MHKHSILWFLSFVRIQMNTEIFFRNRKYVQTSAGKCYSAWSPTVTSARQITFALHKIKSSFNWAFVKSVLKGPWCFFNLSFFKSTYLKLQGTNEAPEHSTVYCESISSNGRAVFQRELRTAMSITILPSITYSQGTHETIRKPFWWFYITVI